MIPFSDADVQHRTFPVVNVFLIGLNALVFLYELSLGGFGLLGGGGNQAISIFFFKWGFIPQELVSGTVYTTLAVREIHEVVTAQGVRNVPILVQMDVAIPLPTWATIFSSMFIHGGFMHFAGNMMFLWVFGDNVEDRMGHLKYLVFYLVAGVAATFSHLAIDLHSQTPLIGASGAISGVLGAYLLLYPHNYIKALVIMYFIMVVRVRAMILLGLWFVWQLIQGLASVGLSDQVSVAFFAHVGGFVAGLVVMAGYKLFTRQPVWPPRRRAAG